LLLIDTILTCVLFDCVVLILWCWFLLNFMLIKWTCRVHLLRCLMRLVVLLQRRGFTLQSSPTQSPFVAVDELKKEQVDVLTEPGSHFSPYFQFPFLFTLCFHFQSGMRTNMSPPFHMTTSWMIPQYLFGNSSPFPFMHSLLCILHSLHRFLLPPHIPFIPQALSPSHAIPTKSRCVTGYARHI